MKHKIVIFGFGSMGSRYYRILNNHYDYDLYLFRSKRDKSRPSAGKELYDWQEVAAVKPDIALITNPTFLHLETALRCARLGMHLYIEKPLDMSLAKFPELIDIISQKNLTAYVAYNLRFHPGIKELKNILLKTGFWHASVYASSWLPDWRPERNYAEVYSARAELGGGVILDLSHEIDYVQYLFGKVKEIKGVFNRVSNLAINSEDVADLIVVLDNKQHVNIHLDYCSYGLERSVKIMTEDGFYLLDLVNQQLQFKNGQKNWSKEYPVERDDLYREQLDYFLANIGNRDLMNNLTEAGDLAEKILNFKKNKL